MSPGAAPPREEPSALGDLARGVEVARLDARGLAPVDPEAVAVEQPLEIRVEGRPVAVVMRTPGDDEALVAGFLLTEGVVERADQVAGIDLAAEGGRGAAGASPTASAPGGAPPGAAGDLPGGAGLALVRLRAGVSVDLGALARSIYAASSCGICGKATIDGILRRAPPLAAGPRVARAVLFGLSDRVRPLQLGFAATGGQHAAALFDREGGLLALAEDVGRHNAADKVLGRLLLGRLPPDRPAAVLWVSGRASFEIAQKAAVARVPILAAVSAPSSLAVDLARAVGLTLVGFLRGPSANVYAGAERIG